MCDSELELNIQTVCRVCLQSGDFKMLSIFEQDPNDTTQMLYLKIEIVGDIKIIRNPELPTHICFKCNAILTMVHKFRIMCKRSDEYLRQFVCKSATESLPDGANDNNTDAQLDSTNEEYLLDENISEADADKQQAETSKSEKLQIEETVREDTEYTELWLNDSDTEEHHGNNVVESSVLVETIINTENDKRNNEQTETKKLKTTNTIIMEAGGIEKHLCNICGNSYVRKYALTTHMRRHRNELLYECEICHASFHLNFQLKRHMRRHTGDRPYNCEYCQRRFSDRSTLIKHVRIHTNERPYTCEICDKSFNYSSVLKVHMLTHTGEKPYTCELCGKRFTRAHHLRAHLETQQHNNDS